MVASHRFFEADMTEEADVLAIKKTPPENISEMVCERMGADT